jgi:hypothetical protein
MFLHALVVLQAPIVEGQKETEEASVRPASASKEPDHLLQLSAERATV